MNNELKERIINEIDKSGYPLEFYCKREISNASGWYFTSGKQYTAKDGGHREIDIETLFSTKSSSKSLYTILMIECKKNESNPWVFFNERVLGDLKHTSELNGCTGKLNYYDIKGHHYSSCKDTAKSFVVAFKPEDSRESRQIYEAVYKVVDFYKSQWGNIKKRKKSSDSSLINQFYFCVVFDGNLVLADLYNGEILLKETQHVLLQISNSDQHTFDHYNIDIVKKEYFGSYLNLLTKDHELMFKYIRRQEKSISDEKSKK